MEHNQRSIDIDARIMEMENQIQDLSDVVADQWKIIDALKGSILNQKDRIGILEAEKGKSGAGETSIGDAREDIPPHY